MLAGERLSPRFPGALIGLCLAELVTVALRSRGARGGDPRIPRRRRASSFAADDLLGRVSHRRAARRAHRAGGDGADRGDDARFPRQRGRVRRQSGLHRRRSRQRASLVSSARSRSMRARRTPRSSRRQGAGHSSPRSSAAAIALAVLLVGGQALAHVPSAALAGVLLFIAMRLVRVGVMRDLWRRSRAEFLLILATALAILALPIEQGVSVGVLLSVLHGVWTTTRAQAVEFERIPGTSVWWPRDKDTKGEFVPGVRVIALQAPLSFLNAYNFRRAIERFVSRGPADEADRDRGERAGRDRLHRRDACSPISFAGCARGASTSPSRGSNPCARSKASRGSDCSR